MKISEVAQRCAVNVQTVRFYERRGLLRDPRVGVGGYREYDEVDLVETCPGRGEVCPILAQLEQTGPTRKTSKGASRRTKGRATR